MCIHVQRVQVAAFFAMFKFAERLFDISFGQAPFEKIYIRKGKSWIGRTDILYYRVNFPSKSWRGHF